MVGDDAAHKVGVSVPQSGHQPGERLLVELPHGAEHPFLGFVGGSKGRLTHSCYLVKADDTINWNNTDNCSEREL